MDGGDMGAQSRRRCSSSGEPYKIKKTLGETRRHDAQKETDTGPLQSGRQDAVKDEVWDRDVTTAKRQLKPTASESNPLTTKKARLTADNTESRGLDVGQDTGPEPEVMERCPFLSWNEPKADRNFEQTTLHRPGPPPALASFASLAPGFVDEGAVLPASAFVSEWLESVGPSPEKRQRHRSSSVPDRSNSGSPVSSRSAKSVPEMAYDTRDAEAFVVPPTPGSAGSRSLWAATDGSRAQSDATGATPTSSRSVNKSLAEDPLYRQMNLAANRIYMRYPWDPVPESVTNLIGRVFQDRDSPGPSADEIQQDRDLYLLSMGAPEPDVEKYFHACIFPNPSMLDRLKRSDRQPMAKHAVPAASSGLRVSTPVPDILYGYNNDTAFPRQASQLIAMGSDMVATNQIGSLLCPFFVVEFKGEGGSLWVATNQCLGGAAASVNIAERLNNRLAAYGGGDTNGAAAFNSAVFSIAMNGSEARLYVSWKHAKVEYHMANVKSFLLQDTQHYTEFRRVVRNIIDWGKAQRLAEIQNALDALSEASRNKASETAKSRQSPSEGTATSRKRCKRSSSRRSSSARRRHDSEEGVAL
ncbi:hypothetical protein SPI_08643 [Niveomyces insectorum RCEF 264]|uniref:DUF7924 domain-containing protein n=1 Tax=Niveomyces insectorum RCEF 264 TaxID=1081102 RepID=A0A167MUM1_9HYPO|nr:hypothetical protein SPI_08643 [Niveomyces insectorum RCEF 264]